MSYEAFREQCAKVAESMPKFSTNGSVPIQDRIAEKIRAFPLPEVTQEPVEIEFPKYHYEAMGCGLEDRGITDRYDAMYYGWDCAVERCMEAVGDDPLYALPSDVESLYKENKYLHDLALAALPILNWYADNYPDCIADSDIELISKIEALK